MKKYKIMTWAGRIAPLGILLVTGLFTASSALAQNTLTEPTNVITSASDITALFCGILVWMFWGLLVLGVAMILIGGYTYATSNGETEKVSKATKTLTYAAIALVVAIVAKGVPSLVYSLLGQGGGLNACQ
jgi:hypothetical protein